MNYKKIEQQFQTEQESKGQLQITDLQFEYQRRLLRRVVLLLQEDIQKQLDYVDEGLSLLDVSKGESMFYLQNLLQMFNSLNFDQKKKLDPNSKIGIIEDLISATFDEKMENIRMKNLKELLLLFSLSDCNSIPIFLQEKQEDIILRQLKVYGVQKVNYQDLFKKQENQKEILLEKYLTQLNPSFPVDEVTIQTLKQGALLQLKQQFSIEKQKCNENNLQDIQNNQLWQRIQELRSIINLCKELLYFTEPYIRNIRIISLKLQEIRFLSFYLTSDLQLKSIMNVIYQNKKLFFEHLIKIHQSDFQSTERDIEIIKLIDIMVLEMKSQINLSLNLLRTQKYVDVLNPHFQFGNQTISTNYQSQTIYCLTNSSCENIKQVVQIPKNFTTENSEQIVQHVKQDFIQIKEEISKDLQIVIDRKELFESQFSSFLEERKNIQNSQNEENLAEMFQVIERQVERKKLKADKLSDFIDSITFSIGSSKIFVFRLDFLLNEISHYFEIQKADLIKVLREKIFSKYYIRVESSKDQNILDMVLLTYDIVYEELNLIVKGFEKESFCEFLADFMINERIMAFQCIFDQNQEEKDLQGANSLKIFQKCWESEYCLNQTCSLDQAQDAFKQQFGLTGLKELESQIVKFLNLNSQEARKLLIQFGKGSNLHYGLSLSSQ